MPHIKLTYSPCWCLAFSHCLAFPFFKLHLEEFSRTENMEDVYLFFFPSELQFEHKINQNHIIIFFISTEDGWLVCQQQYTKNRFPFQLGWRMGLRIYLINFCCETGTDAAIVFLSFFNMARFTIYSLISKNHGWN